MSGIIHSSPRVGAILGHKHRPHNRHEIRSLRNCIPVFLKYGELTGMTNAACCNRDSYPLLQGQRLAAAIPGAGLSIPCDKLPPENHQHQANPAFIAGGGELTFDTAGNLYMVADNKLSILRLSLSSSGALPWVPLLLDQAPSRYFSGNTWLPDWTQPHQQIPKFLPLPGPVSCTAQQCVATQGNSDQLVMPAKAGIQHIENPGSRHAPG
mgnify:CR=1 FL=1